MPRRKAALGEGREKEKQNEKKLADGPRLVGAWGSLRRDLALRAASGGRPSQLVCNMVSNAASAYGSDVASG